METTPAPYTAIEAEEIEQALRVAIEQQETVIVRYNNDGEITERPYAPFDLQTSADGHPYVRGFDHNDDGYKNFRLDRVLSVTREPIFGDARTI